MKQLLHSHLPPPLGAGGQGLGSLDRKVQALSGAGHSECSVSEEGSAGDTLGRCVPCGCCDLFPPALSDQASCST